MTEDEAMQALGHLVGGLNGFNDTSIDEYMAQFTKLDDAPALDEVCEGLVRSWTDKWKPTVAEVVGAYHAHPRVREAREARVAEAMLDQSGGRIVAFGEGQAIANDAYKAITGRNIGEAPIPNPEFAENLIINEGRRDREGNWVARYSDVLRGFRGDQSRAQVSLRAIGRRLAGDNRGNLVLRPPDEPYQSPAPESAAPTPPPSERPPEASGLLAEALGTTRRRMEEEG
jgi:hypothetical protein